MNEKSQNRECKRCWRDNPKQAKQEPRNGICAQCEGLTKKQEPVRLFEVMPSYWHK
jgi:hypothetical protein